MKQLGATCLMVFILIAGFTGPIHYRILLEPSSSMNSQQVSTSPCSIVWLLNAVLQLRALIFIRPAAQDTIFQVATARYHCMAQNA